MQIICFYRFAIEVLKFSLWVKLYCVGHGKSTENKCNKQWRNSCCRRWMFAVMMLLRLLIYLIEFRKDSSVSCHDFITGSLQVAIGYGHAVCLLTTSKGGQLTNSFVYYHLVYSSGFIWNVPANIWSLRFLILLTPAVTAAFLSCKILLLWWACSRNWLGCFFPA